MYRHAYEWKDDVKEEKNWIEFFDILYFFTFINLWELVGWPILEFMADPCYRVQIPLQKRDNSQKPIELLIYPTNTVYSRQNWLIWD